ncbi:MAG: class I adenylate-forming enzyme family protein [Clostridia bacterium]
MISEASSKEKICQSMYNYMLDFSSYRNNLVTLNIFDKNISFDTFISEVEHLSHYLISIGVKKGDSVCVCLPNIPQAVIATYAINRVGAILNIVHPLIHSKGLAEIIEKTGSKVVFLQNASYCKYALGLNKFKLDKVILCSITDYMSKHMARLYKRGMRRYLRASWVLGKIASNTINYSSARTTVYFQFPEVSGDDIAIFMHSGGTTGEPKTIMISNKAMNALPRNLLSSIAKGENGYQFSYKDAMFGALPLFHGYGLGVCVHFSLCCRMKLVLVPMFNAKHVAKTIKANNITAMAAVPRMYQKVLSDKRFSADYIVNLKNAYCGGDKMEQDIKIAFDKRMAEAGSTCVLQEGYGLSETVNVCVLNTNLSSCVNSIGRPLDNIEVQIVDANNNKLPPNTNGELCVSSETLMAGYLNDEETTNVVFFTDSNGVKWLKTGDLAYINDNGFVFFVDRLKRLIKISGMNVFPAEIERTVTKLDFIEQACAVKAKQNFKTIIVLNITLKKGVKYSHEMEKEIYAHCEDNLSKWAQPTLIIVRDKLPTTAIGKIDFKALDGKID